MVCVKRWKFQGRTERNLTGLVGEWLAKLVIEGRNRVEFLRELERNVGGEDERPAHVSVPRVSELLSLNVFGDFGLVSAHSGWSSGYGRNLCTA